MTLSKILALTLFFDKSYDGHLLNQPKGTKMLRLKGILGIALLSLCLSGHSALIFTPSTPKVYPGSSVGDAFESVIVNSSEMGLSAIWRDSASNQIVTTISTDLGNSWSPLQTVGTGSIATFTWITGNQTGILSGNAQFHPDYSRPSYYTSFYSNGSWSSPKDIGGTVQSQATDGTRGIFLTSSEKLFLATWSWATFNPRTAVDQTVYVNISSDGINWLPEPIYVGLTYMEYNLPIFPTACIKDDLFLVTWLENNGQFDVKVTLSSDGGKTWSVPATAATAGMPQNACTNVNCFALPQGFLLTYSNEKLYSVFSADGIHWSNPSLVAIDSIEAGDYLPAVCGNECGIAIAWVGQVLARGGYDIYISTSDDLGATWSVTPLTQDGSVCEPQYLSDVSISIHNNQCVVGWKNREGNAVMCYGTLSCSGK